MTTRSIVIDVDVARSILQAIEANTSMLEAVEDAVERVQQQMSQMTGVNLKSGERLES